MTADNILAKIVEQKWREIHAGRDRCAREEWRSRAEQLPPPADFLAALRRPGVIRVIAEIKKASPSAGIIRPNFDPVAIAQSYARHGADCLSVLTDEPFFHGSIEHLRAVHGVVDLPLLRKDFVLDPQQVYEARLAGASAVLLIAECLEAAKLRALVELIQSLRMTPLVELFDPENLDAVLASGTPLVGINNRNLRTFVTDLRHTLNLFERIPADRTVVSESGIGTREDVQMLEAAGVSAILVGEAFMRAPDPGVRLAELLGRQERT